MNRSIHRIIPAFEWIANYDRNDLIKDVTSGLIVAIMLIPQGMAYAMLAGLPPIMGLYASTLPVVVYAFLGSSRHLSVGPVAIVSLLVFIAGSKLAEPGSDKYIHIVLSITLLVGLLELFSGILGAGFLVNYLSPAVISGFTSASAIIICIGQFEHILGIKLSGGHSALQLFLEVVRRIEEVHFITFGIALVSIAFLLLCKKTKFRFAAPILAMGGGSLLVYLSGLDKLQVKVVGYIPQGLPRIFVPSFDFNDIKILLPAALTIVFVGYTESIAMARVIAAKEKYKINPDQELKGLGLANIVAAFCSSFPVTGGFSRTAVSYKAGSRTLLSSLISAIFIIMILLFFTQYFYYLPKSVLAATIIVAVLDLVNIEQARKFFKIKKADGWTLLITFILTVVGGVEYGIIAGIVFSLSVFIWRSAHPHMAELGYLDTEDIFRNIKRFPEAKTYTDKLILRIDSSIYFANAGFIEEKLHEIIAEKPDIQFVIFDLSGVNDIDAGGISMLEELMESYGKRKIRFLFAGMKGPIRDLVNKAGWKGKYDIEYNSIQNALGIGL